MNKLLVITAQLFFISTAMSMEPTSSYLMNYADMPILPLPPLDMPMLPLPPQCHISMNIDEHTSTQNNIESPISICKSDVLDTILFDANKDNPFVEIPKNALVCKKWAKQTQQSSRIKKFKADVKAYNISTRDMIVNMGKHSGILSEFINRNRKFNLHIATNDRDNYAQYYAIELMKSPFFYPNFKFKEEGYADLLLCYKYHLALENFMSLGGVIPSHKNPESPLSFAQCEKMCHKKSGCADKPQLFLMLIKNNFNFSATPMLSAAIRSGRIDWVTLLIKNGCDVNKPIHGVTPLLEAFALTLGAYDNKGRKMVHDMIQTLIAAGAKINESERFNIGGIRVSIEVMLILYSQKFLHGDTKHEAQKFIDDLKKLIS